MIYAFEHVSNVTVSYLSQSVSAERC
jgi:hypothetical protein